MDERIRLPEIKTAELTTYRNFAKCHQALFRVPCEGLGMRLSLTIHPSMLIQTAVLMSGWLLHEVYSSVTPVLVWL